MSVDFLGALGAGSDIDSKSLVQALVDAERMPRETSLNSKISNTESEISAYGRVLSALGSLSAAFSELNDASDFADYTVNVNGALALDGSPAYSVAATAEIEAGINEIVVTSVATKDRWVSDTGFAQTTTPLNGGNPFTVTLTVGGVATPLTISDPSPQGVIDAVNTADLGIEASLVNTGDSVEPYKILFSGQLGASNTFDVVTDAVVGNTLTLGALSPRASNAEMIINGVAIERPTNIVDDVISGVTLTLSSATASTSQISVIRDKSGVETRLRNLVEAFNETNSILRALMNPDSGDEMAGVFSGDSGFRLIADTVKSLITGPSSTGTENLNYLNDIGLEINRSGLLEIDEARLTEALTDRFDEVVTLLSADTDNQSIYGDLDRGIAGDAISVLTNLMASDGAIATQNTNLATKIADYEEDLENLNRRMSQVYDRYLAQFTAMETAIDRLNSTKEYLTSALDGLPFNNRNSN